MQGWRTERPPGLRSHSLLVLVAVVGVVSLLFLALFRPDIGFTIYFP